MTKYEKKKSSWGWAYKTWHCNHIFCAWLHLAIKQNKETKDTFPRIDLLRACFFSNTHRVCVWRRLHSLHVPLPPPFGTSLPFHCYLPHRSAAPWCRPIAVFVDAQRLRFSEEQRGERMEHTCWDHQILPVYLSAHSSGLALEQRRRFEGEANLHMFFFLYLHAGLYIDILQTSSNTPTFSPLYSCLPLFQADRILHLSTKWYLHKKDNSHSHSTISPSSSSFYFVFNLPDRDGGGNERGKDNMALVV